MIMKKIFSFDAETNGLWGQAFAISAAVYEDGRMTNSFTAYLGPDGVTDEWVQDNVLPNLGDLAQTHSSYDEMLVAFAEFYKANKVDADIIAHMGVPVESRVLFDMHAAGHIGDWDGPFPFLDVAGVLKARGYDPTSVDSYNKKFGLMTDVPEAEGFATHHPLYDSVAAAVAYIHLIGELLLTGVWENFIIKISLYIYSRMCILHMIAHNNFVDGRFFNE